MDTEDNEVRRNAVLDYVRVEYAEELGEKDAEVQRWRTEFRRNLWA